MIEFHYEKDDSRLLAYEGVGTEVSYFCYICHKNIKILAKMSVNVFPHTQHLHTLSHVSRNDTWSLCNSSDGGNFVTFSQAVRSDKEFVKNYNTSQRA